MSEEKIFSGRAEVHKKKSHRISRKSLRVHTSNANYWLLKRRGLSSYGDNSQHASYRGPCQQPAGHVIPLHPPFNDYLLPLLDQENGWEYLNTFKLYSDELGLPVLEITARKGWPDFKQKRKNFCWDRISFHSWQLTAVSFLRSFRLACSEKASAREVCQ